MTRSLFCALIFSLNILSAFSFQFTEFEAWDEIFGEEDQEQLKKELPAYAFGSLFGFTMEQIQFELFNAHDLDQNGKLDGLEMLKAIHRHNYTNEKHAHEHSVEGHHLEDDAAIIDVVLSHDDLNGDGFLEYAEFVAAKKKDPKSKVFKNF